MPHICMHDFRYSAALIFSLPSWSVIFISNGGSYHMKERMSFTACSVWLHFELGREFFDLIQIDEVSLVASAHDKLR